MNNEFMYEMTVIYSITDVRAYIDEANSLIKLDNNIFSPNPEKNKLRILNELFGIYCFATPCRKAVQQMGEIIAQDNDLDSESVRKWVEEYYPFYKAHLSFFCDRYQDENGLHDGNFYLSEFNLYVERDPFLPIIQFWYLMNNLYWGQHHLPNLERKFEELSPNDYYYKVPDPNTPSDLEIINRILELK